MRRNAEECQRERHRLLRHLVEGLQRRGYSDIRVSGLDEYEGNRPGVIFWEGTDEGFFPDVVARKDGLDYLFAIEMEETVGEERAARQVRLFSAYARHSHKHFCLVVPEAAMDEGRAALLRAGADEQFTHLAAI